MNATEAAMNATEAAIRRLHDRYVRTIDDDALESWPDLFEPDGRYRVASRENVERGLPLSVMLCEGRGMMRDRVTGFRRINVYEPQRYSHQVSGLAILREEAAEEGALVVDCVSNFLVVRTLQGGAMSLFATGVYRDRIVVRGEEALFRMREAVTDSRQIDTLLVIPL